MGVEEEGGRGWVWKAVGVEEVGEMVRDRGGLARVRGVGLTGEADECGWPRWMGLAVSERVEMDRRAGMAEGVVG